MLNWGSTKIFKIIIMFTVMFTGTHCCFILFNANGIVSIKLMYATILLHFLNITKWLYLPIKKMQFFHQKLFVYFWKKIQLRDMILLYASYFVYVLLADVSNNFQIKTALFRLFVQYLSPKIKLFCNQTCKKIENKIVLIFCWSCDQPP